MLGRFLAVAVAVLFVLPVVLLFDALLRPAGAWSRIGRSRWRWVAAFAFAPAASLAAGSFVPAIPIVAASCFYLARVRSLLEVSTGLALAEQGRRPLTPRQQDALGPLLLAGPPLLVFLGIVLWTGDARGRVVATAMALGGFAVVGATVWRNLRQP